MYWFIFYKYYAILRNIELPYRVERSIYEKAFYHFVGRTYDFAMRM